MKTLTFKVYMVFTVIFWIIAITIFWRTITSLNTSGAHYFQNYNTKDFLWNFYKLKKQMWIEEVCFVKDDTSNIDHYEQRSKILLYIWNDVAKKYCNFISDWSNPLVDSDWNDLLTWNNYKTFYLKSLNTASSNFKLDDDYYDLY